MSNREIAAVNIPIVATAMCAKISPKSTPFTDKPHTVKKFVTMKLFKYACHARVPGNDERRYVTPMFHGDTYEARYICARLGAEPEQFADGIAYDDFGQVPGFIRK